jgi:hypothetical protein
MSIPGIDSTADDEWLGRVDGIAALFDCIKSKAPNPNPMSRIRRRPIFACKLDF